MNADELEKLLREAVKIIHCHARNTNKDWLLRARAALRKAKGAIMSEHSIYNDALGKPVVVGSTYGYTSQDGSWGTVVVGKVKNLTPKKVTLEVISRKRFLYGKPSDEFLLGDISPTVSIQAYHLFPVQL